MPRHDTLIIKDTHRGLLYEDGVFQSVLPAGRYQIPREPSPLASFFGARCPRVEVVLVDVRGRDRSVVIKDLLTADGATISASFAIQFRVTDPLAAIHQVKNFEERLFAEVQTAARRVLRGLNVEEILGDRDEIGEEMLIQVRESAESLGVEVGVLDFKDLTVPDELRKLMNRAVIARRLHQLQPVEGSSIEEELDALDDHEVEDDSDLIIAKGSFSRRGESDLEVEGGFEPLSIRPPVSETRGNGFHAGGFDGTHLRCRP